MTVQQIKQAQFAAVFAAVFYRDMLFTYVGIAMELSAKVYSADRKSCLDEVDYGNGGKVKYGYDDFDRVTDITHDEATAPRFTYEYDAKGRAAGGCKIVCVNSK